MDIKQYTLKLKYQVGELSEVTRVLAHDGVNILGLYAREVEEYAIVRMVVDDAVKAERLFRENGIEHEPTAGLLVLMAHTPGALHLVTEALAGEGIGIIYLYLVVMTDGHVGVAFKLDELEDGYNMLKNKGINVQIL